MVKCHCCGLSVTLKDLNGEANTELNVLFLHMRVYKVFIEDTNFLKVGFFDCFKANSSPPNCTTKFIIFLIFFIIYEEHVIL